MPRSLVSQVADWPLRGDGQHIFGGTNFGSVEENTSGRPVVCGINQVGASVELFSNTVLTAPASGLLVHVFNTVGAGPIFGVLNVGFGTSTIGNIGTFIPIIPNLMVQPLATAHGYDSVYFPISIPAFTAVTAYGRASSALTMWVSVHPVSVGFLPSSPLSRVTDYGMSAFQGALLTPTGVLNGKSTPVVVGSPTTVPTSEIIIAFGHSGQAQHGNAQYLINIYRDGVTGTQYVIRGIPMQTNTSTDDPRPRYVGPIPVHIPAGVQLAADIRTSTSSTVPKRIAIYGVS